MPIKRLEIFTDGACIRNPGPGGWAFVIPGTPPIERYGGEPRTTSNKMELTAILEAMKFVKSEQGVDVPLRIYSDSQYSVFCLQNWVWKWRTNGWLTKEKKPVKNRDLLEELADLMGELDVMLSWVKGHNGHIWNEAADKWANYGARVMMDSQIRGAW